MSLRARVTAWIGLVLVACLAAGALLAGLHARRSVQTELSAALEGGVREVRVALAGKPATGGIALVRSFDAVRHLQATLRDARGHTLAVSHPMAQADPAPRWFEALLAPRLQPVTFAQGGETLTLSAVDANEVGEAWAALRDDALIIMLFVISAALVVYLALGRALRPLTRLSASLAAIAEGDTRVRARETGPRELAALARSFNAMAERLGRAAAHAHRLEAQMLSVQDEERADLARDLHDEIGPHLFAMKVDAAVIRDAPRLPPRIAARARAIEASVAHVQAQVRAMLGRLRPAPLGEAGLAEAIDGLVDFWRERWPEVAFSAVVEVDDQALDPARRTAIHRLVQEGLNNALRHGRPSGVEVFVGRDADGALRAEVRNDGVDSRAVRAAPGAGLLGMGERVGASGGVLSAGPGPDGAGWRVCARWVEVASPSPAREPVA